MMHRRRFLKLAAAGAGAGLGVCGYTWGVEPHWIEFVERRLPVANLPFHLVGSRLMHLTDLHIGPQVEDAFLLRTFQRARSLSPDFVAYTGDFISHEPGILDHARSLFPHLPRGRRGTFGVLGNHDYGEGWSQPELARRVAALAEASGIRILRNESADAGGLRFVGMDDYWAGGFQPEKALTAIRPDAAAVVLSHNPDTADLRGWGGYAGWILAGHTHGGQCKPPFLPPPLLPVVNRRYTAGEFQLAGGRRMYISRGVGHLLAVRFNVRPEVTIFRLERG